MKKLATWFSVICVLLSLLPCTAIVAAADDADPGTLDGWSVTNGAVEIVQAEVDGAAKPVIKLTKDADATAVLSYKLGEIDGGKYDITVCAKLPSGAAAGINKVIDVALAESETYTNYTGTVTVNDSYDASFVIELSEGTEAYIASASVIWAEKEYFGEELLAIPDINDISDNYLGDVNDDMLKINDGNGWGWTSYNGQNTRLIETTVNGETRKVIQFFPISNDMWGHAVAQGDINTSGSILEPGTYECKILGKTIGSTGNVYWGMREDAEGGMSEENGKEHVFSGSNDDFAWMTARFTVDVSGENGLSVYSDNTGEIGGQILIAEASVKQVFTNELENLIKNSDFTTLTLSTFEWQSTNGSFEIIPTIIGDEVKNVLKLNPVNGQGITVKGRMGALERNGKYLISAYAYTPGNPGSTKYGFSNNITYYGKTIPVYTGMSDYEYISAEFTNNNGNFDQWLTFIFEKGDATPIYLYDISVNRVYSNGVLGENCLINPNFTRTEIDESDDLVENSHIGGWKTNTGEVGHNWTVRNVIGIDGTNTNALVGYSTSGRTELMEVKQDVTVEYGATYALSFKAKTEGPVTDAGIRMYNWVDTNGNHSDYYKPNYFTLDGSTPWTQYTKYYTMPESPDGSTEFTNTLSFTTEGQGWADPKKFIIDDITFRKVITPASGTDAAVLGDNIIVNGDFEINAADMQPVISALSNGKVFYNSNVYLPSSVLDLIIDMTFTNSGSDSETPILAVGVYQDGKLISLDWIDDITIPASTSQKYEWNMLFPEDIDYDAVYTAKAFMWNTDYTAVDVAVEVEY